MSNPKLTDSFMMPFSLVEFDDDGNPASPVLGDTINVVSNNPNGGTVQINPQPDPGTLVSGFLVGGKALGTVTFTATVLHADGTAGLNVNQDVDIVAGLPASLGFVFGTPIPQTPPAPPAPAPPAPPVNPPATT